MSSLMYSSLERSKSKIFYRILVGSSAITLAVWYSDELIVHLIVVAFVMCIVLRDLPRVIIEQPYLLKKIASFSTRQLSTSWISSGIIDTTKSEDIILGFSFIGHHQFITGAKYDSEGIYVQFLSYKPLNVLFFNWDCVDAIDGVIIEHKGSKQNSVKLKVSGQEFILPWDKQFDYVFENKH